MHQRFADGDHAYIVWTAETADNAYEFATDTFVVRDGKIVAAAVLSNRYITDRFLPDKAIDLVDESAARLRMEIDSMPAELDEAERQIRQLEIERQALRKESGHTGEEVVVAARGPGAERVRGFFQNTYLFQIMMAAYGWMPDAPRAFGHPGAGGQLNWCDPDSGISFSFLHDTLHRCPGHELSRIADLHRLLMAAVER